MRLGSSIIAAVAGAVLVTASAAARADVFTIDNFSVSGAAGTLFNDNFNNGLTLNPGTAASGVNLSTGTPANYLVSGTGPITEANGLATLNTANGISIPSIGTPFSSINQISAQLLVGLSLTGNFTTAAVFNLSPPSLAFNSYGVQLIDLNAAQNGNIAAVRVVKGTGGQDLVSFLKLDRINGTSTNIGSVLLDPNHDQILLELSQTASSDMISGAYEYIDGGVGGPLTTFSSLADLSGDGRTLRRAAFNANGVVPSPRRRASSRWGSSASSGWD